MSTHLVGGVSRCNIAYGGRYKVNGTVSGVTGKRKVRLYDRNNGQLVAEVWSDNTNGAYLFNGFASQDYYAVAVDYMNIWNCAVADRPPLTGI